MPKQRPTVRIGFVGAGFVAHLHAEAYRQVRGVVLFPTIAGAVAGSVAASSLGGGGGKTGSLLQGLGGVLGGETKTQTNAPSQTTTNQGGTSGFLRGLGGLLGGPQPSTPPATNAAPKVNTNQPATNQSPVGNLLNQLLGPGKK